MWNKNPNLDTWLVNVSQHLILIGCMRNFHAFLCVLLHRKLLITDYLIICKQKTMFN